VTGPCLSCLLLTLSTTPRASTPAWRPRAAGSSAREQIQRSVIKAIREYATEHYSDGGWDVIVEAYDDQDIAEIVGNVSSLPGAIAKFATIINVYSDRQADAVNSAF
jgi:hypothetical protein